MSATALMGMDLGEIRDLLGDGEPAYRASQIYHDLYRNFVFDWEKFTTLPVGLRRRLLAAVPVGIPQVASEYVSSDGTRRYLLQLVDGRTVETVLMPEADRDTVCISTQVGCPVDCKFCLTALLGMERNLTAGEIVAQVLVLAARHSLSPAKRPLNVVMMGQGEPLLNLANVIKATRLLVEAVGLSERRLTASTSGIVPRMKELGQADVRPKLAISLNASTEEQRREIMPITRKHSLANLLAACKEYPLRPWEKLTFEYVLLAGVNDSDADARRVVRLLSNLNAKVNLIALNPGPGIPYKTPAADRVAAFQALVARAMPCFVRKPRGLDIYAACGQLQLLTLEAQPAKL